MNPIEVMSLNVLGGVSSGWPVEPLEVGPLEVGLLERWRSDTQGVGASVGNVPASRGGGPDDVPVVASFAAAAAWLGRLSAGVYVDGVRRWPVAELYESLLDLRLAPESAAAWRRLPEDAAFRSMVRALLDDRDERVVRLPIGQPLNWLTIGDGLVVQLGCDKAMVLRECGAVVLRFAGGERFPLRLGVNSLGRGGGVDVNLAGHPGVSRNHALIELLEGDRLVIVDQGSRFGTTVEVAPSRLVAALVGDLRWRTKGHVLGTPDGAGRREVYPVEDLIADIEAAVQTRVPLTFMDAAATRPTTESCQAVAQTVARVTRADGLRAALITLLLAKSVHRPCSPGEADLWPEGSVGVRWSDGLFLDVLHAVLRNPMWRRSLLDGFARRLDGAWVVRFPGADRAEGVVVTAAEVAAWREEQNGPAVALPEGDVVVRLAYERDRALRAVAAPSIEERTRAILERLLPPSVTLKLLPTEDSACLEALRQPEAERLVLAVGGVEVCALGRVGAKGRWVEQLMPRAACRRRQLPLSEFQQFFRWVVIACVPMVMDGSHRSPSEHELYAARAMTE